MSGLSLGNISPNPLRRFAETQREKIGASTRIQTNDVVGDIKATTHIASWADTEVQGGKV